METRKYFPDDELHFGADQHLQERFEKDEVILMSYSLSKYNKRQKCQERALLITSKAIYNINKFELVSNIISFFKSNYALRRKISIEKVTAITFSESSSEFVIHVKDEYDYRYSSPERYKILAMILKSFEMNVKKPLTFFYKKNLNLHEFTTTEDDVSTGIMRMPTENPILMERKRFLRRVGIQMTLDDFDILKTFDPELKKTMVVEEKDTKQIYIIKSMPIGEENLERYVLEQSQSPWIVQFEFAFQTPEKLFLGMKHMSGGELDYHLRHGKRFNEERAKFYAAEIILGLEYLHNLGVIYRDLKPEYIMMDEEGHICLRHFASSKRLELGQRTDSIVGTTPEYLFPEMVKGEEYGHSVDWWALGNVVYEMLVGLPAFYQRDRNTRKIFDAIRDKDPIFPPRVRVGEDAKDFILQLLQKDPEKRLGSKEGADEVKKHKWLADINWELLAQKKVVPPYKPRRQLTCQDYCYEDPLSVITSANMALIKKYENEFKDFVYIPGKVLF